MAGEIDVLVACAHEVGAARTPEETLQITVDRCALLLGVVRVAAYLLDEQGSRLSATARAGMPIHRLPVHYTPGEGLLGWIAQKQLPLRTGDAESDPRFVPRESATAKLGSFVGVPMIARGRSVGVLSATHPDPDYFSEHHEKLLSVAAALAAGHLRVPSVA